MLALAVLILVALAAAAAAVMVVPTTVLLWVMPKVLWHWYRIGLSGT